MSGKPWREIARPHRDVLEGSFKQAEFAADLSRVAAGTAPPEYQDAQRFFARTYITEGTRLLLISVAQRLAGKGGDPVVQLQTAFGGGKTHTMLAVWHLATRKVRTDQLEGIPPLLDQAGIHELPSARTAVLDGIALSVSQGQNHGAITANTLWGELAWQLLGEAGYQLVAQSDRDGTAPGKDVLADLLRQAAPCVVLMDELQKYFSDLQPGKALNAGTYEANLKFVQALTEAFKSVPNAMLLATLPESEAEIGDAFGQKALTALEKHFGRVESVWKPVGSEEAFEIVRRRLFESAGDRGDIEKTCRQFCELYRNHPNQFPAETQTNAYFERMCGSFPIHPEIFDRLYEDWSTLDKFQRTRGVLQYLATVIHRLYQDNNQDPLILPGSLPLADATVRIKSLHYLPPGWEPILEKEVDGPRSTPHELDNKDTRFGRFFAAHKVMRTIFLGSAPAAKDQVVRGLQLERIYLGTVFPGQTLGVFEDVLKRLRDRLHYLYSDKDRYWLDTRPNLRREMEGRKQTIDRLTQLEELRQQVSRALGGSSIFAGIHVFTNSHDIPDDYGTGPRLVVLGPEHGYSRTESSAAFTAAERMLLHRGDQPRQKRNRLLFLISDAEAVSRLLDGVTTYLAWRDIAEDIDEGKLNLDLFQAKNAKRYADHADRNLKQLVRETYKWLVCPMQDDARERQIQWEVVAVSTQAPQLRAEIQNKLLEEEWVTQTWSPILLKELLERWYFKEGIAEVSARKVFQDTCHYLYLPRLINEQVFHETVAQALASRDFFGFAAGREGDRYLGFSFGHGGYPNRLDDNNLLLQRDHAMAYLEKTQPKPEPHTYVFTEGEGRGSGEAEADGEPSAETGKGGMPSSWPESVRDVGPWHPRKKRFFGSKTLDTLKAKIEFASLCEELILKFPAKPGVKVRVSVDIEATAEDGFDETTQRTIRENSKTLGLDTAEFSEE